ncbi:MAG: T9SS type A sorting domain-containing protein [Bacteroidia bacterium]|nr:T9SS type A sorting domain-containing protein [Bacteroidia bacterium]
MIASHRSASNLVAHCVIENNAIGVQANHCSNISCNRICNNTTYNFKLTTSSNRSIANNYWCTNDSLTIANSIYDGYDNVSLGIVSFMPIDTVGCYLITGIPIYNNSVLSFNIFPNPATDKLSVSGLSGKGEINIFNTIGEKCLTLTLSKGEVTASVNVSELSPGIYFVSVRDEKNDLVVRKVVKM